VIYGVAAKITGEECDSDTTTSRFHTLPTTKYHRRQYHTPPEPKKLSQMNSAFLRQWIATSEALKLSAQFVRTDSDHVLLRKRKSPEMGEEFKDIDYTKTNWGLLIRNPKFPDKLFRRRFRLPFQLFEILVNLCKEMNVFEAKVVSRIKIPVEIKLLCCLRVLGRDECFCTIEEMSDVPEKTVWWFFKVFIVNFPKCLKSEVLRPPKEGEELEKVMNVYKKMGFPGAVGSVDATHIRWHMCPVEKVHLAQGKEKYPSVAFQVRLTNLDLRRPYIL
jgi:hypothetical protein